MSDITDAACPYATETIWDGGPSGTGWSKDGHELALGREDGWAPEQLLLFGAEGCFMNSFLAVARSARLQILGYVSSGHLDVADDPQGAPRIVLRPCVVVRSADDAGRAVRLSKLAIRQSIVGRLLGDQLRVTLDVQLEQSA